MKRGTKGSVAQRILPYAATILSVSVAVSLRIEKSCSAGSIPNPSTMVYPLPVAWECATNGCSDGGRLGYQVVLRAAETESTAARYASIKGR